MGAVVWHFAEFASHPSTHCYVDTSALYQIWEHTEKIRLHNDLDSLFQAARSVDCTLVVSPLVLHELFGILEREAVKSEMHLAGSCYVYPRDVKAFRSAHPTEFTKARATALGVMRNILGVADKRTIKVVLPCPAGPDLGKKVSKIHRKLLETHAELGSMDALHIAISLAGLGCAAFVSSDADFLEVDTITVYCP